MGRDREGGRDSKVNLYVSFRKRKSVQNNAEINSG